MGSRLGPEELFFEYGRLLQSVSVVMPKQQIVKDQQVCACGRLAIRMLPFFGIRCEVACEQRDLAYSAMHRMWTQVSEQRDRPGPVIGRATPVRRKR